MTKEADIQFLSANNLARTLGITRTTLYREVERGVLPKPIYVASRAARWRLDEVLQALEARRASPREAFERGIRPRSVSDVRNWRPTRKTGPEPASES